MGERACLLQTRIILLSAVEPQISHCEELVQYTNSSQNVKNWYQYVTYLAKISHTVKYAHEVNFI